MAARAAVLVVGHGSRAKGFESAMKKVARRLAAKLKTKVTCAYLEIAKPSVPEAVDALVRGGAREIRVLPYFVQLGLHVREDMPALVAEAKKRHRGRARITLCPYLGYHDKIVQVAAERLKAGAR
jgi:sirohydrochlorin ferrochelatase